MWWFFFLFLSCAQKTSEQKALISYRSDGWNPFSKKQEAVVLWSDNNLVFPDPQSDPISVFCLYQLEIPTFKSKEEHPPFPLELFADSKALTPYYLSDEDVQTHLHTFKSEYGDELKKKVGGNAFFMGTTVAGVASLLGVVFPPVGVGVLLTASFLAGIGSGINTYQKENYNKLLQDREKQKDDLASLKTQVKIAEVERQFLVDALKDRMPIGGCEETTCDPCQANAVIGLKRWLEPHERLSFSLGEKAFPGKCESLVSRRLESLFQERKELSRLREDQKKLLKGFLLADCQIDSGPSECSPQDCYRCLDCLKNQSQEDPSFCETCQVSFWECLREKMREGCPGYGSALEFLHEIPQVKF